MANNTVLEISASVAAVTGLVRFGPTGTALPTDSTTALNAAYVNLGYVNEDGVQPAREISTESVLDSNGAELLKLQTEFSKAYTATLLQVRNADLVKAIYGTANVTVTAGSPTLGRRLAILDKGLLSTPGILIIDSLYGLGKHRRVMPIAQITAVEEGPLVGRAVRSYGVTFSASPDSSGNYEYIYDDDGVVVP